MTGVPYDHDHPLGRYAVGMVKVETKYAEIECALAPAPPKEAKPRAVVRCS